MLLSKVNSDVKVDLNFIKWNIATSLVLVGKACMFESDSSEHLC